MLKENLIMLRKLNGYSQEQVAEKIEISRQAYAKWESGATIPDIEKAARLAEVYGVTIDGLMKTLTVEGVDVILKDMVAHVIAPVLDEVGIALFPAEFFESKMQAFMDLLSDKT